MPSETVTLARWLIHVGYASVLGLVFAAIVCIAGIDGTSARTQFAASISYGVLTWVVSVAVVVPIWLSVAGSPDDSPLPNVDLQSFVGHGRQAVLLGVVYGALEDL